MELEEFGIRVNAILPGAVDGTRLQNVLQGRAQLSGDTVEEEMAKALNNQSLKYPVDPRHIADLALFWSLIAGARSEARCFLSTAMCSISSSQFRFAAPQIRGALSFTWKSLLLAT